MQNDDRYGAMVDVLPIEIDSAMQNYELLEKIGQGGMGHVWRARHKGLERDVAIKFMDAMLAQDPIALERFLREARLLAKIDHPNVVRVYDMGVDDRNQPFIAMELLQGVELADHLKRGPLPEADAVEVARQVLSALDEAHRNGIIHRDIKSSNIVLLPNRTVKLLDFGIARDAMLSSVTSTGKVIGTPAYMSPEQAEGLPATPQSDLYSVGIVIYEMLMGSVPFKGETPLSVLRKQADTPAPALPNVFSPHVRAIVSRVLEKKPENRFVDARSMLDALTGYGAPAVSPMMPPQSAPPYSSGPTNPGGPPTPTPPGGTPPMQTPYPGGPTVSPYGSPTTPPVYGAHPGATSYPTAPTRGSKETATSWVMGVLAAVTAVFCNPLGYLFAIMGFVFGGLGKKKSQRGAVGALLLNGLALAGSIAMSVYIVSTALPEIQKEMSKTMDTNTVSVKALAFANVKTENDEERSSELESMSLSTMLTPSSLLTRQKVLDAKSSYARAYEIEKRIDDREDAQLRQLISELKADAGGTSGSQTIVDDFVAAFGDPDDSSGRLGKLRMLRDQYYTAVADYLSYLASIAGKYTLAPGGTMFQFPSNTSQSDINEFNRLTNEINASHASRIELETNRNTEIAAFETRYRN